MKKLLTTLALCIASQAVNAAGIPTNVVYNDGSNVSGPITELNFNYESESVVTDTNSNGILDNGDTISSIGGAELYNDVVSSPLSLAEFNAAVPANFITSSVPGTSLGFASGYNNFWQMSFAFDNLKGTFNTATGGFNYTSGDIDVFGLYGAAGIWTSVQELFTISINGTSNTIGNIHYSGAVSAVALDYFTQLTNSETFATTLASTGTTFVDIEQNAFGSSPSGVFSSAGGTFNIDKTSHDGTITFSVPEPTSIAILGLGLLGFAGARRRKS